MKKLTYSIEISAPAKKVWYTMLDKETYTQWVAVSWPGSLYQGEWKQGTNIRFIGNEGSGTMAFLDEVRPYAFISAKHVAILLPGGVEDRESEMAKGWLGIVEQYAFTEHQGITTLDVTIETNPAWEDMFNDGWPNALLKLKELCERK